MEATQSKWEGKTSAELKGSTAEEVWPLVADFCNFVKWFPNIDTCRQVEGVLGQPGLVRYCASAPIDNDETSIKWAKEKLVMIDPIERLLSYEVIESNIGFDGYVSTWQVVPINGDGSRGCKIEWSFVSDPIEGMTFEDLQSYVKTCLQFVANKMEDALLSTTTTTTD